VDLIAELGLTGRIRVHADVERTELLQLYREASVFVRRSHEEGLGIASLRRWRVAYRSWRPTPPAHGKRWSMASLDGG
jgi:glycosyltransferase involved in cell wall biosynthesis